jgi:hypothetical protein
MHEIAAGGRTTVAGEPGERLLRSPDDIVDVIGACFEHGAQSVLLYAENLPDRFFDLSSGEAGAILQKMRNYHLRLAIVAPEGTVRLTDRFREMALEESRGNDFRVFGDEASAQEWLAAGS